MVNVPGRSRGCATCRKRRVKCDEFLPECLACIRMRLPCPGARTGTFFVHAVPSSSSSHEMFAPDLQLPGPQPSRASAFDQLFVSHFVESFFGTMKPPPTPGAPAKIWLHELPMFLASSEPSSAKPAIRAASMISYGTLASDVSIKTAARKWYAEALHHLQCQITKGDVSVDENIICTIVMLIHFETWAGTSQKAWLCHLKGAAMLLQVVGPERCSRGFMHQVFSHLRFQMFVATMTENEVPVFASQEWMTIPFRIYPKLIFDQLIDVLFSVLKCLSVANQLIKSHGESDLRSTLDSLIRDTMLQASQWWPLLNVARLGSSVESFLLRVRPRRPLLLHPDPFLRDRMRIAIIGAGISGCAVYLELKKHLKDTPDITIYEAYDTARDTTADQREQGPTHSSTLIVGGGLAIAPNGLGVLRRLGDDLLRDITRNGYVTSHSNLKDKNGNALMRMEPGLVSDMYSVACSRHSLWRCLRDRIPDDHIVNKRVLKVVASAQGKNTVHLVDDSDPVEADLVIGADGVRSIAKEALFPEAKENPYPPNYEGLVGIGGFVAADTLRESVEKGSINFVFGGSGFFGYFFSDSSPSDPERDSPSHVCEPGDSLAWWSTYEIKECPDAKSLDMDDVMRQLRERHDQWKDPVVQSVLKSAHVQNMFPTWTSPELPTWECDGVVLLGDAAHALPPTSGQGASQALEDCEALTLFLAHHLSDRGQETSSNHASLKQAINKAAKQYMNLRRPRVRHILKAAQKMQNSKRSMGAIQEYAMYTFMKVIGFFPSLATKPTRTVIEYNVAEEVARVLDTET
ncbi:hypothetical protein CEP54_012117 [Fusarium duplospermum]|uniref:Zn(2)-C6 fungal-type domain-containing protein n=1 Tax=Fusarium duplospermum TaxID=1325734 RepID=A0A428PAM9_9HYPO|nr:hypothetical protein CEP54_012117 [Fusarium duplospermum]